MFGYIALRVRMVMSSKMLISGLVWILSSFNSHSVIVEKGIGAVCIEFGGIFFGSTVDFKSSNHSCLTYFA